VKNAAEAMPKGGRIIIGLREIDVTKGTGPCLAMTIDDNGPGIPNEALEKIFVTGYTSRAKAAAGIWPQTHRGLGLAIVRSIVEGAGGRITAANRPQGGASFTLELPVTKTGKSAGLGIVDLGRSRTANADRESRAASHSSRTADC
jgi:signal transduction histidine kinase